MVGGGTRGGGGGKGKRCTWKRTESQKKVEGRADLRSIVSV